MRTRVLLAGDLHKRPKDISTISGYCLATARVQDDLVKSIIDHEVTHFVSLGDWYDKGYVSDIPAALVDVDRDIHMSNVLNDNFFGVIGNHISLSLDSNPELHLIQPHDRYVSRRTYRDRQVIRTPEVLNLDHGLQISLLHHSDENRVSAYKSTRNTDTKFHVAVYHTPLIIPSSKLPTNIFLKGMTSNEEIEKVTRGVDLAVVGDIHTPIPPFEIHHIDGSVTVMVVPGSLCNNNSSKVHPMISAPMITADEEGVSVRYLPIDLHTNMLTINATVEAKGEVEKLKSFRGKSSSVLKSELDPTLRIETHSVGSLSTFLRSQGKGDQKDIDLITSVCANPTDIIRLAEIFGRE